MDLGHSKEILKKIALILIGLSSLALLVVLLLTQKPPTSKPSPRPTPSPRVTELPLPSPPSREALGIPPLVTLEKERESWRKESTKVSFNLETQEVEERLMVYKKLSEDSTLTEEQTREIARRFGFSGIPQESKDLEGTIYSWQSGARFLSLNLNTKVLDYSIDRFGDPTVVARGQEILPEKAKLKAQEFLKEKNLANPYLDLQNPTIAFAGVDELHISPLGSQKKEIAFLGYPLKINNQPLLISGLPSNVVKIALSAKEVVISLKTKVYDASWQEFREVKLIGLNKAKEIIIKGGGIMVANSGLGALSETLKSYELNNVYLAYYGKNPKEEYLQPIYVFGGKGILEDGLESNVFLYLPAVE